MSSHHVVREKQEPALLILGLDDFTDEQLGQLLEWSPTVIATRQTAERLIANEIKVDWIITDGSVEVEQPDVKLMSCGENSPAQAALKYLTEYQYPAINIVTDELNLSDYEPFADAINLVIFSNHQKIYLVTSGFSKWKPGGEIVSIWKAGNHITTSGLKKLSDTEYQTIADGFFSLQFDGAFLFIAEDV